MKARYAQTALILSALLAQPALAAKQTVFGINTGSPQMEMILGSILAIAAVYSIYKSIKEGKGANTALVLMAMVIAAWQNGGFNSVEKALNIMIAIAVVQTFLDMKEEKGSMAGGAMRMVIAYMMVQWIALEGWDSITAILMGTLLYSALSVGTQMLGRKETWDTLFHLQQKRFGGGLTSDGEIAEDDARNLWLRFLGKKSGGDSTASPDDTYKYSAKKIADELRRVAKRIKPQGI